jgi:hypothetical protein
VRQDHQQEKKGGTPTSELESVLEGLLAAVRGGRIRSLVFAFPEPHNVRVGIAGSLKNDKSSALAMLTIATHKLTKVVEDDADTNYEAFLR